jgi:sulfhydrogenase subunit alpha
VCRNPFQSIVVRTVELIHALDEAIRLIDAWHGAPVAAVSVPARPGVGHGATEAPRGLLYHRYRIDGAGTILDAQITPPTAQNQPAIEADLRSFVQDHLHLSHEELTHQCEVAIRTYDPCISCATHFLDLDVEHL